jgi:hypothetical protein
LAKVPEDGILPPIVNPAAIQSCLLQQFNLEKTSGWFLEIINFNDPIKSAQVPLHFHSLT